jgi:Domain of unknown function DUF29
VLKIANQASLYNRDLNLWIEEEIEHLKAREFDSLDVDHLIEELEGLAGRDRRELESRLSEIIEHVLKRCYVTIPECYRGWVESVIKQRKSLKRLLKQSPSLKPYFSEVFDEVYQDTLEVVRQGYPQYQFPDTWPFSRDIDPILTDEFWHG